MFGLGFFEILVILVVILVVVGPDKLPQFAQTLGRAMWQLRRAAEEFKGEVSSSGFTFDAGAIRKEVNELKSLLIDDSRRLANQVIEPPPKFEAPATSQPHNEVVALPNPLPENESIEKASSDCRSGETPSAQPDDSTPRNDTVKE